VGKLLAEEDKYSHYYANDAGCPQYSEDCGTSFRMTREAGPQLLSFMQLQSVSFIFFIIILLESWRKYYANVTGIE
jgi:hypothetical protein